MIMVRFIGTLLIAIFALAGTAFAQNLPIPSVWENERGSIMKALDGHASNGDFHGTYINNVGSRCRGTPYDLTGQVDGTRVVFTVVWKNSAEDCRSKTVWSGDIAGRTLATTWILTREDGSVLRGSDTF